MSHYMTALAMRQTGLKPAAKIVLYWLADHHNSETGQCNPSINRLAKACEMSRRAVEGHLQKLQEAGLIEIHNQRREQGGKTSNAYTLLLVESDAQNLRMGSAKSAHGDAQNLRMKNLGSNNLGIEHTPKPPKGGGDFDAFWQIVPKKVGKGAARKAFASALKRASQSEIMDGMKRHAKDMRGKDARYIPNPATWLNQDRWEDEPAPRDDGGYAERKAEAMKWL